MEDLFGESVQWRWIRKGEGTFCKHINRVDMIRHGKKKQVNENRTWIDIDGGNRHDLNIGRKDMKWAYVS